MLPCAYQRGEDHVEKNSVTFLQQELQRRAHRVLKSELARRMGYRRVNEKLLARIDPAWRDAEHERLRAIVRKRRMGFQPYVFVDTNFKRASQPIFSLAFMEPTRHLSFEPSFCDLGVARQVATARERVREHYAATGGELPLWGVIQRYLFFYGNNREALILDTGGSIVGETERLHIGRARLSVGGADITEAIERMGTPETE